MEEAKERTNNNDYQIDNTYYDKYIRSKYEQLKNSSKNTKYDEAKEYEDYYMYDAMHLGWRGWIDFERDLYKLKK